MEPTGVPQPEPLICWYCHQPVQSNWYFCPNCGNKLHSAPLSTTTLTQLWIYAFSIILPLICYLAITKWPGQKYFRSEDPKAKRIGAVAWALLILSTLVTLWLGYLWFQSTVQSTENAINTDMTI